MLTTQQAASRLVGNRPRPAAALRSAKVVVRAQLASEAGAVMTYKTSTAEGLDPCLQLLRQAATDKSVKPELVEGALAYLEQNHAKPAADINGTWRLVFSTATSNRLLQYIPVQEDFVIQLDKQYCALDSAIGPLRFIISGNVTGWQPATGAMDFQFTAVDIQAFGNKVWQVSPKTKPKTYTFFYKDASIAAARSSTGGLALLRL